MSKTACNSTPKSTAQTFWAPPELPFLELRTTLGSVIPYASHFHQSLSLGLILEGRTSFNCPDESYFAETGDIVLIEPGLAHSCNPVGGQARGYHMLYLDAEWCRGLAEVPPGSGLALKRRVVHEAGIYQELCKIVEGIQSGKIDEELAGNLTGALRKLLLAEARAVSLDKSKSLAGKHGKLGREGYIRAFRREKGITPGSYALVRRLEQARELLRGGTSIAEAALACGFTDQSHFHRLFVRYFAATPRQYLQNRSLLYKK